MKDYLTHDFNGYPIVDTFALKDINQALTKIQLYYPSDKRKPKFLVYYEDEKKNFMETDIDTKDGSPIGIPVEDVLSEFNVKVRSGSLMDLMDYLWATLFGIGQPDRPTFANSKWVMEKSDDEEYSVAKLKKDGRLKKILLCYFPYKGSIGNVVEKVPSYVYVNYSTILIDFSNEKLAGDNVIDLMIVLGRGG